MGRDAGARASDTLGRKDADAWTRASLYLGRVARRGHGVQLWEIPFIHLEPLLPPNPPPRVCHILSDMYFFLHLKEPPAAWPVASLGAVWTGLHRQPK